jgi:histidinol-phosphate aminotransferase
MEVLCAATSAFGADGPILAPDLFWDAPARFAERRGIAVERVPMRDDLHIDLAAMRRAHRADHGLVHIVNPNNPTGLELPPEELRMFVDEKSERTVVLVDEAYLELAERPEEASMVDLVRAGKNVVITRTFSKIYGLAGLRVGYAIAQPDAIRRMRGQMTSFGGNMAGLAAALASYGDDGFLDMSRRMVIEGRRMVMNGVTAAGLTALPSSTNFVLVKVPDADAVRDGMRARGVLIRGAFGDWTEWSRVSLGTPEDLSRYVTALPEVIAGIG